MPPRACTSLLLSRRSSARARQRLRRARAMSPSASSRGTCWPARWGCSAEADRGRRRGRCSSCGGTTWSRWQEKKPRDRAGAACSRRSRPIRTRTRSARMPSWPISKASGWKRSGKPKDALDSYGAAVAHAYWFLLDPNLDRFRNPYDPQFRRACDLYNESLAAAMRIVIKQNKLRPGETHVIQTGKQQFQVEVVLRGPWHAGGHRAAGVRQRLRNRRRPDEPAPHLRPGRAADRRPRPSTKANRPPSSTIRRGCAFPVTAFLRVEQQTPQQAGGDVHRCTLELYDPLFSSDIAVCNRLVPLETDLSTPLALFPRQPGVPREGHRDVRPLRPRRRPRGSRACTWSSRSTPTAFPW